MSTVPKKLLSIKEVAVMLDVAPRTVHRYLETNQLSGILLGSWKFEAEEVERFKLAHIPESGKGARVKRKYIKKEAHTS